MKYEGPKLTHSHDAPEPFINEIMMKIHHTRLNQGYVDKLTTTYRGTRYG